MKDFVPKHMISRVLLVVYICLNFHHPEMRGLVTTYVMGVGGGVHGHWSCGGVRISEAII